MVFYSFFKNGYTKEVIMKIGIGNDTAGTNLKYIILKHLESKGFEVIDFGAAKGETVEYPVAAKTVSESVLKGEVDKGIHVCATGIGISMAANKINRIRAALCADSYSAKMAAEHTDAHIIALGAKIVGEEVAIDIVDSFLNSKFSGGVFKTRIDLMSELEK